MKNIVYLILLAILFSGCALTQINSDKKKPLDEEKIFIKKYKYNLVKNETKDISKQKAIDEIKVLIKKDMINHIKTYIELKDNNITISNYNFIQPKIEIIKESWDNKSYNVKASSKINEKKATQLLIDTIKEISTKKDLIRLNKISQEQEKLLENKNKNISKIEKKLVSQEVIYISKKDELIKLKKELDDINKKLKKELDDINKAKKEISKVKRRVAKLINKACLIKKGMTREEVKNAIGKPTSTDYSSYYYKDIEIHFQVSTKLVDAIRGCK